MAGSADAYYVGVGARVVFHEDEGRNDNGETHVGIRVPFGLHFEVTETSLELFGEIVPVLDVAPNTEFDIDAAVGVRYLFR